MPGIQKCRKELSKLNIKFQVGHAKIALSHDHYKIWHSEELHSAKLRPNPAM